MTLQPGPLSPGMVSLLTAGRSVLRSLDTVRGYREFGDLLIAENPSADVGRMVVVWYRANNGNIAYGPASLFEYVGERSDDGWITAPPGGWGSNPVGDAMIAIRCRGGYTNICMASAVSWTHPAFAADPKSGAGDIIAFRLVDEATQESGSLAGARPHRATVPPGVETYEEMMAKPRRMLLLASYCGGDTVQCSDDHPCADCLADCNTFMIPREALDGAEYAGTLPGIVQGEKPLKKRLPPGWKERQRDSVDAARRVSAAARAKEAGE